jgi:hypothetical protein
MSATLIEQQPLPNTGTIDVVLPVGQEIIYTVSNSAIVSGFTGVKFIAEVFISGNTPTNPNFITDLVGTFKTTPNNAGVGMFDFRPIIESFVNADNLAREGSSYKTVLNTANRNVPMHLIDKFSGSTNTIRYFQVKFSVEYIDALGNLVSSDEIIAGLTLLFNGYLKHSNELIISPNYIDFGFDFYKNFLLDGVTKRFLTNAPNIQYANIEDYGTVGLYMGNAYTVNNQDGHVGIELNYYDSDGNGLGSEQVDHLAVNGGYKYPPLDSGVETFILFFGCFPANLQGWSTLFNGLVTAGTIQGGYYTIHARGDVGIAPTSELITINLNCPNTKGFEPIRLTWLNQWGAWDYYTFTMKSSKMISTKGSTYQQLEGSWNEGFYKVDSFKGGKKSFRVNATEKVTMNTDFVTESESEWFEDLINSPEVYILEGFKTELINPIQALNKYVTPVRLTTSSYTKKTVANDRLIQYTFEVEKSKTLRTQAV